MGEQASFMEAALDVNLGLCNVMLPLTPRTSVKVTAANINPACDIETLQMSVWRCRLKKDQCVRIYFSYTIYKIQKWDQFRIQKVSRSFSFSTFLFLAQTSVELPHVINYPWRRENLHKSSQGFKHLFGVGWCSSGSLLSNWAQSTGWRLKTLL